MTDQPAKLTGLGKLALLLFIAGCCYGAYYFFVRTNSRPGANPAPAGAATSSPAPARSDDGSTVELGVAYGTEKERWLRWAADQFVQGDAGHGIHINLIPMGSLEGARAVLADDHRINVWTPASSLYRPTFEAEWLEHHIGQPIARAENLALSPLVFVMWKERYDAFVAKYGEVSWKTLGQALAETSGWQAIAAKPEWGLFKFGHTHPNESNSGLAALVLMAYDFAGKTRGLTMADILNPAYATWSQHFEQAISGLSNSTGNMMRDMVLKGPSTYDALVVYESVAIDYLKNAEGRWGELRVTYPKRNFWSENPYYVLDVPWSSPKQREAAGKFLDFLLSERVQKESLNHGFRPGNPAVPIRFASSPFVLYEKFGMRVDLGAVCEAPPGDVLTNLLAAWERARGTR